MSQNQKTVRKSRISCLWNVIFLIHWSLLLSEIKPYMTSWVQKKLSYNRHLWHGHFMLLTAFNKMNFTNLHQKELGTKALTSVLEQIIMVIWMPESRTVWKQEGALLVGRSFSGSGIICILPALAVLEDKVVAKQSQSWTGRFRSC